MSTPVQENTAGTTRPTAPPGEAGAPKDDNAFNSPRYVPAAMMLNAVDTDPQFRLPRQPAFIPGALVVPMTDGLVVEGGPERQVFRGRAATQLLPSLIPLLDGTRTIEEAAERIGTVSAGSIRAAVALLYTAGLLHDGPDEAPPVPEDIPGPVATFVGRSLDSTRARRSPGEAFAALRTGPLSVVDTGMASRTVADLLRRSGDVPRLVGLDHRPSAGEMVVVVCEEDEDTRALSSLDQRCADHGAHWVRVRWNGSVLEVGPRFEAANSACYDCFVAGRGSATSVDPVESGDGALARTDMWIALAANEIFCQRARIGTSLAISGTWAQMDLARWRTEQFPLLRRPGCPRCLPGTAEAEPPLPYVYEQGIAFPPRELMDPKAHQAHYKLGNILIQREHRSYDSAEQKSLPRHDLDRLPSPSGICDVETLTTVLLGSYGLKPEDHEQQVRRYPPTGGNLGSPQAFVIVQNVVGLEPGVYYYDPFTHRLSVLATITDGFDAETATREAGVDLSSADAVIVTVSALARVAKKYGNLALRICLLDAGVARAAGQAIAADLGLVSGVVESWEEQGLMSLLGLDDDGLVTSVLTLSGADA